MIGIDPALCPTTHIARLVLAESYLASETSPLARDGSLETCSTGCCSDKSCAVAADAVADCPNDEVVVGLSVPRTGALSKTASAFPTTSLESLARIRDCCRRSTLSAFASHVTGAHTSPPCARTVRPTTSGIPSSTKSMPLLCGHGGQHWSSMSLGGGVGDDPPSATIEVG